MLHISDAMKNFKKDKVLLLTALQTLVKENLEFSSINTYNDEEVADTVIELTDKKRIKNLKKVLDALNDLVKETVSEKKLHEQERKYNEEVLVKLHRADAIRAESHQ
jgi:hypothetical protein